MASSSEGHGFQTFTLVIATLAHVKMDGSMGDLQDPTRPGQRLHSYMERSTIFSIFFMGKLTINGDFP